jgi:hypothetical protein
MSEREIRIYAAVRVRVSPGERVHVDHSHYDWQRDLLLVDCGVGALVPIPRKEVDR